MARRTADEVEALRRRIVAEATRLFAEQGFGATSVQEVADALGINKTRLLYHYPSKEALRTEVLSATAAAWESFLPHLVGTAADPEAAVRVTTAFLRDHPHAGRFVLRELLDARSDVVSLFRRRFGGPAVVASPTADAYFRLVLRGMALLMVVAVFPPDENGLPGGLPGGDPTLGARLLVEALRALP